MKFLASTLVATALSISLLACGKHAGAEAESEKALHAAQVSPANYKGSPGDALEVTCKNWKLSAKQVELFFSLSEQYAARPYSSFYQIPCSISGKVKAEGKVWDFVIGGGATATWKNGKETRYWGCTAKACESLVVMAYDGMDPGE